MILQEMAPRACEQVEFIELCAAAYPHLTQLERTVLADLITLWANNGMASKEGMVDATKGDA